MAERRRGKKKQQEITEKPTKIETAVAKHLRFNVPTKEGKLVGLPVQYFIASEAVNCLLESKWSSSKNKTDALFTNRSSCVDFCNTLLLKGMFHRAGRIERRKDKDRKKKKALKEEGDGEKKSSKRSKDETTADATGEERKEKKEKKSRRKKDEDADKKDESEEEKKKEGDNDKDEKKEEDKKKKKKEKKIRLEMVDHQVFKDGEEIYVWIYDPVPFKTFIIGLFLVLGAIGVCLFPLWPPEVRLGVYYTSLTVASLIGCLLALCVIRVIIFAFIWVLTLGRHHFWLLPNLNEDVGFFDSFKPLYHYEYHGDSGKEEDSGGDADNGGGEDDKKSSTDAGDDKPASEKQGENKSADEEEEDEEEEKAAESGTASELDNDNGYEIVDRDDIPPDNDDDDDETKKDK